MALQIKAKTFPMPNLGQLSQDGTVDDLEEDIENWVKLKLNDGFSFLGSVGGDAYIILIAKKE